MAKTGMRFFFFELLTGGYHGDITACGKPTKHKARHFAPFHAIMLHPAKEDWDQRWARSGSSNNCAIFRQ
jgi:hypothetical protein